MANQFINLLGKDYNDPTTFGVKAIDDKFAIGIASVVTKEHKRHNWANNEDATGIWTNGDVTIAMVADAHWGYVASQEAVLRFPNVFQKKYVELAGKDVRQVYLEAILDLCDNELLDLGKRSGVSYGLNFMQQEQFDSSNSQFYSVIKIDGKHYFVGLGDCLCAIVGADSLTNVESQNIAYGEVGGLSPRNYMRMSRNEGGLAKDANIHFDDPLVRKGVDVKELNVNPGDTIFMCTDGYTLDNPARGFTLSQAFYKKTAKQGIDLIMEEIIKKIPVTVIILQFVLLKYNKK
ncbi:MAG TPA: protein phosphatase 2C domain-containing protein [Candidatus Nanoarchaeia archaeon]|nr:protein phosphatase 2C domain-containing protein [Candidatus Nanoarchaeia archaeon]